MFIVHIEDVPAEFYHSFVMMIERLSVETDKVSFARLSCGVVLLEKIVFLAQCLPIVYCTGTSSIDREDMVRAYFDTFSATSATHDAPVSISLEYFLPLLGCKPGYLGVPSSRIVLVQTLCHLDQVSLLV